MTDLFEKQRDYDSFKSSELLTPPPSSDPAGQQPNLTPERQQQLQQESSSFQKRRVVFALKSEVLQNIQPPNNGQIIPHCNVDTPLPLKSILKPSARLKVDNHECKEASLVDPLSMLESAFISLHHGDRRAKLDVYLTIAQTVKVYQNFPPLEIMKPRMNEFTRFAQRDLIHHDTGDILDLRLSYAAHKVIGILLWQPELAAAVDVNLAQELLETSRKVVANAHSKKVLNQHLWLLATQRIPTENIPNQLTSELLTACASLNSTSLTTCCEQLNVVSRFITSNQTAAIETAKSWFPMLFRLLQSERNTIRQKVCSFVLEIKMHVAGHSALLFAITEYFDRVDENGRDVMSVFIAQCTEQLKQTGRNQVVPQIWGTIVRLLGPHIRHWNKFNDWLRLIQLCFNNPQISVKAMAQYTWIHLMHGFSIVENVTLNVKALRILSRPLELVLNPASMSRQLLRRSALSSVKILIYLCLRPNGSHRELNTFWHNLFKPVVISCMLAHPSTQREALEICCTIFDVRNLTTPWSLEWMYSANRNFGSEVGFVDPHWLRVNFEMVKDVIHHVLIFENPASEMAASEIRTLKTTFWAAIIRSLSVAGSREIRISRDSISAFSHCNIVLRNLMRELLVNENDRMCCPVFVAFD